MRENWYLKDNNVCQIQKYGHTTEEELKIE